MDQKGEGRYRQVCVAGQTVRNVVVNAAHVFAIKHKCGIDYKVC